MEGRRGARGRFARRLKVAQKTITRVVDGVEVVVQQELDLPARAARSGASPGPAADGAVSGAPGETPAASVESIVDPVARSGSDASVTPTDAGSVETATGAARIGTGSFTSRYAGATLLHPFLSLVGAETILAAAAVGAARTDRVGPRFDDLAVLTGTCVVFGLGFAIWSRPSIPTGRRSARSPGSTCCPSCARCGPGWRRSPSL